MNKNKKALIIVDIQNDFVSGTLATDPEREFVKETAAWLKNAKGNYDYIATTQDWHIEPGDHFENWPVHCEANTIGAELSEHIVLALDGTEYTRFLKGQYDDGYSGFEATQEDDENMGLWEWARAHDIKAVDIIGIATEHCVLATATDGVAYGLQTTVLKDYVNGVSKPEADKLLSPGGKFERMGAEVK